MRTHPSLLLRQPSQVPVPWALQLIQVYQKVEFPGTAGVGLPKNTILQRVISGGGWVEGSYFRGFTIEMVVFLGGGCQKVEFPVGGI